MSSVRLADLVTHSKSSLTAVTKQGLPSASRIGSQLLNAGINRRMRKKKALWADGLNPDWTKDMVQVYAQQKSVHR